MRIELVVIEISTNRELLFFVFTFILLIAYASVNNSRDVACYIRSERSF